MSCLLPAKKDGFEHRIGMANETDKVLAARSMDAAEPVLDRPLTAVVGGASDADPR
jgi:hypothetical protein